LFEKTISGHTPVEKKLTPGEKKFDFLIFFENFNQKTVNVSSLAS